MTETKMISEREAVLRQREAYVRGFADSRPILTQNENAARDLAKAKFPLPKIVRPRVERLERCKCEGEPIGPREFRFVDGAFEHRDSQSCWLWERNDDHWWDLDPAMVTALAILLASPLEEVEDSSDV